MSLYYYMNNESISKTSINNYEDIFYNFISKTPTLKEALAQMFISYEVTQVKLNRLINEIISKVNNHINKKFTEIHNRYPNITKEEAKIISSYTCELSNKEDSNYNPYKILNQNLVSENRKMGIRIISKYLFIFLKSLRKLKRYYPDKKSKYLYRCINTQVQLNYDSFDKSKVPYLRGETKIFWAFSSASNNAKKSYQFLGTQNKNKSGTIFTLTGDVWGYDIKLFNVFDEDEILLEPERKIFIKESIPPVNNIIHVRCKILETPIVLEKIFKLEKNKLNQNIVNISNKGYFNTIDTYNNLQNSNNNNYNEPDLKNIGNLNINSIINAKNGNEFTASNKNKQKILFHSNSDINLIKSINNYNNFYNSINNSENKKEKIKKIEVVNLNKKDNFQYIHNNNNNLIKDIKKDNNNLIYTPIKKDTQFKIYESATKTTNSYNLPKSSKYASLTLNNNNSKVSSLLYSNSEKNILKNQNTISNYNVKNNPKDNYSYKKLDLNIYKTNENNAILTPIKKNSQHIISYSNNIGSSINYTEPNSSKYSAFPKINIKKNIINCSNIKGVLNTTKSETTLNSNIYHLNPKNNETTLSKKILINNSINNKKDNIQYQNNYNFYESNSKKLENLNINNILNAKKEYNKYNQSNLLEYTNGNVKNNNNSFCLTYSNSEKNIIKSNNVNNLYKNNNENNYFKTNNYEFDNLNINKIINSKKADNMNSLSKPISYQHIKYNSSSNYLNNLKKPSYNPVPINNNNYYQYSFNQYF